MNCKTCGRYTDRVCATCEDSVCEGHLITHRFGRREDDALEIEVCAECSGRWHRWGIGYTQVASGSL